MRQLATIQRIVDIQLIEGADRVVLARVLGWQCVVKKGEFSVGDMVVYIEVDSITPERPEFEFLRETKFRIKTRKFRGAYSQGLVMPMSILPQDDAYKVGDDVTKILGIVQFNSYGDEENPVEEKKSTNPLMRFSWYRKFFGKKKSGKWPEFITKTDEERIQKMPEILRQWRNVPVIVTEKVDGQSATFAMKRTAGFWHDNYEFYVCSRNNHKPTDDGTNWWKIAKILDMKNVLRSLFLQKTKTIVLQGEIFGNGIQGNKYGLKDIRFAAYNLVVDGKKFNTLDMSRILSRVEIKTVPVLAYEFYLPLSVDDLVAYSNGKSFYNEKVLREGVVIRDYGCGVSFKVINPEFLVKNNE